MTSSFLGLVVSMSIYLESSLITVRDLFYAYFI